MGNALVSKNDSINIYFIFFFQNLKDVILNKAKIYHCFWTYNTYLYIIILK